MTIYNAATKPYLYVWLDKSTKKRYVGIHNGKKGYSYIGSGTLFVREYYARPNDFSRVKIIHHDSYDYIQKLEIRFLKKVKADLDPTYYNMVCVASFTTGPKSDSQKQKMSAAKIGRKYSDEHRANMSEAHIGMVFTASHKEALSTIAKNRPSVNCPHCNKVGKLNQMKRWHFDNCRSLNTQFNFSHNSEFPTTI